VISKSKRSQGAGSEKCQKSVAYCKFKWPLDIKGFEKAARKRNRVNN